MRRSGLFLGFAALVSLAGCSGDIARQITSDAKLRESAMSAIAADGALAEQMAQHLVANDSLRARVIETVLQDDRSAQYVLARIGRSPDAVGYVLQAAASDSAGRANLLVLLKGLEAAAKRK